MEMGPYHNRHTLTPELNMCKCLNIIEKKDNINNKNQFVLSKDNWPSDRGGGKKKREKKMFNQPSPPTN